MEAAQILSTQKANATTLFPGDDAQIRSAFRKLAGLWHPDHNKTPEASDVFRRLIELRDAALAGAGRGRTQIAWRDFPLSGGRTFRIKNLKSLSSETGEILVGPRTVSWALDMSVVDLVDRIDLKSFNYADPAMRKEMEKLSPKLRARPDTLDGKLLIYERTEDQILLADLIEAYGGAIPPEHVAWLISGMENIACWLGWMKVSHGAIGPQSLLISPKFHSVALTGPALYATRLDQRPTALPERTIAAVPRIAMDGELATPALDLDLIRLTAREALGDPAGAGLLRSKVVPEPMAMWLVMPPSGTAQKDFASWERARDQSFGPPKFVEMQVSPKAVYDA